MSSRELSASSCSAIEDGSSSSSKPQPARIPDVADVPDLILEALHIARGLQVNENSQVAADATRLVELLRPALAVMAAAAEQLAEVA